MDELVHGSPAHRPLTEGEFVSWMAYDELVREQQQPTDDEE